MSKMSPKAKALYDKHDKEWFTERVVELERELDHTNMTLAGCIQDNKTWFAKSERLEAENIRLQEMTKGMSYADFLWDECSEGNITQEEYYDKLKNN